MSSISPEKSWGTKRKRVIKGLVEGRDSAAQLQNLLLLGNSLDHGVEELAKKILKSFTHGLSVLNSCVQIQGNNNLGSGHQTSENSGESVNLSTIKGRRGCYKRRKTIESRMSVSSKLEDAYSWRKYGQKRILGSKYPRCYFRCSYKPEQGCQALKQVQQLEDDNKMFSITYFGQHTCKRSTDIVKAAPIVSDSDYVLKSYSLHNVEPKSSPIEDKEETTSDYQLFNDHILDSAISWQDDVMGLESSNKPPMFLSTEIRTNDQMDSSVGYLCRSPSSYILDVNMEMSLISSPEFDNWDFHCDPIELCGAPS